MADTQESPPPVEDFASLLDETLDEETRIEGRVVKGTVVNVDNDAVLVDVGLKSEGRIPLREFGHDVSPSDLEPGTEVEVFVDRYENRDGVVVLSREKARREEAWIELEKAYEKGERVEGTIFGRVKGGFTVDLNGAVAFLPGSQVDIRPVRDVTHLMNNKQPFQILKMDRARGNIVVSRRAVLEETRAEQRSELISNLEEGQVLEGVVKNITDYGAFIDLGGVDGLLHVTDISWRRINHPTEVLQVGQTVNVQVIRFNEENQRISLGMKQLEADPWEGVEAKYPVGGKFKGRVTNITDYGAFVELEPGIEGLVHVSEMSWTKKNIHPGKIVSTSEEVEVVVLDVDPQKRRISLGLKQTQPNPRDEFAEKYAPGTEVEGEVKNITEFGLFIGLEGDIDGMVHTSDLSWEKPGEEAIKEYNKGDVVKATVLDVDTEKERISLGIKQLTEDPFAGALEGVKKGDVVTCTVSKVTDNGLEVTFKDGQISGFIKRSDLAREHRDQRPDRFAEGEKVDAKINQLDPANRRVTLSIKALEVSQAKRAMKEYGSSDSGASLGDILGPAIAEAQKGDEDTTTAKEKEPAKKTAAKKSAKSDKKAEEESKEEPKAKAKTKAKEKDEEKPEAESESEDSDEKDKDS